MAQGKRKQLLFWVIFVLLDLIVIELACSEIFFQTTSSHPLAMVHYYNVAKKILFHWMIAPVGIYEHDARMGYSHKANSTGRHRSADFDVTYTIGKDKERYIPEAKAPLGRILFLGCSYTFGSGVNDAENYPYLLSKQWSDWQAVNRAVGGWGTAQAYMALSEEMRREDPPSMVIYGMLADHVRRNYIRRSWVELVSAGWVVKYDRSLPTHPHFELVDDKLAFQGLVDVAHSQEDSPEVRDKEVDLTRAFLLEMQQMCRQRQVPFVVIYLGELPPRYIRDSLIENKISVLDLSGMRFEGFPNDSHPNARDHQRIADAISKSFVSGVLTEIAARKK